MNTASGNTSQTDPIVDPKLTDPTLTDPTLIKRARIAKWVSLGQRLGYGAYAVSMGFFAWGIIGRASDRLATACAGFLIAGSIVLLPAIIFGYAVKAAEREDRQRAAEKAARIANRI